MPDCIVMQVYDENPAVCPECGTRTLTLGPAPHKHPEAIEEKCPDCNKIWLFCQPNEDDEDDRDR